MVAFLHGIGFTLPAIATNRVVDCYEHNSLQLINNYNSLLTSPAVDVVVALVCIIGV